MRNLAIAGALVGCLWSITAPAQTTSSAATETRQRLSVAGLELTVSGDLNGFTLDVRIQPLGPGVARAY